MTRCRSYPFRSIQSAERQQETVPAQMRTEAPAQTSTEAPAQMRTEAPAQTSTEAPAQMWTEAPAQTSTEAPAQMRTDASAFDYATYMARRGFFRQAYV